MSLENIAANIRPRTPWEAADLGMLMALRWWWPLVRVWLLITLPVMLLLTALPGPVWVPMLVFWWLKPFWERPVLYVLSRELFGETPTLWESLRKFPAQLWPRLFITVLWGRISLMRAMNMPLFLLEGLKGKRLQERLKLMHAEDDQPAQWVLIIGCHLEAVIYYSIIFTIAFVSPVDLGTDSALFAMLLGKGIGALWLYYLSATVVAPFHVACGFALYLNRRVKLEAWDIELAFRKMHARRAVSASAVKAAAVVVLAISGLCMLPPNDARAAEPPVATQRALEPAAARAAAEQVLAGADFHEQSVTQQPKLDFAALSENRFIKWILESLLQLGREQDQSWISVLARGVEVLLWTLALGVIGYLLWHWRRWVELFNLYLRPELRKPAGAVVSENWLTLVADPQGLPTDVEAECLRLWQQGNHKPAVALLYRATLSGFLAAYHHQVLASDTEGDFLRAVRRRVNAGQLAYFRRLNITWINLAYGGIAPQQDGFSGLCRDWSSQWQTTLPVADASAKAGGQ